MHRIIFALLLCVLNLPALAQGQFAGFYTGTMHLGISGNVTMPERPIGPVAFTIDAAGNISSSGDLSGTVNASGAVTWVQPNGANFQAGQIADNVLRSTGVVEHDGAISTYRVEARSGSPALEGASPFAGRLERVNPSRGATEMIRVRFANGRFVAVGRRGAVAFSEDGVAWSHTGLNTNADLLDVAYGNGTYVVLGFGGVIYTSPDGVAWTRTAAGGTTFGGSVAFGNGIFLLRQGANTSTSTDGVTWTPATVTVPGGLVMSGVDFAGNNFVINSGAQVVITPNGADMVSTADARVGNIITSDANRQKVAFGNGVYVVGGLTGVSHSADGVNWTVAASPASRVDTVIFANGIFVIQDAAKNVWTSTTGATWEAGGNISSGASGLAFGNGRFVAVGAESHTSVTGRVWSRPSLDFTRPDINSIFWERQDNIPRTTFYHDEYFAGSADAGPLTPQAVQGSYMRSTPARLWFGDNGYVFWFKFGVPQLSGTGPALTSRTLRAATFAQSSAFIGGDGGTIIRVDGGNTGEPPVFTVHPSPTTADLHGGYLDRFVGSGGTILKNAQTGNLPFVAVASGTTETLRHIKQYTSSDGLPSGSLWIAVGDNGTILTSPNGDTWTKRTSGTTAKLIGSAFRASGTPRFYVAAGEDGTVVRSLDGVTWTADLPLPIAQPLRSFAQLGIFTVIGGGDNGEWVTEGGAHFTVAHTGALNFSDAAVGNGKFVLVGGNGTAASVDGRAWASRRIAAQFNAVTFGGGRFVGVGPGFTATSGDGLNWTVRARVGTLSDVAFGGGKFAAVGDGGIWVSTDGAAWVNKSAASASLVTYGNGRFVAQGASASAFSTDGETWTTGGGVSNQRAIAFGNGVFLTVGTDGRVATSATGTAWSARTLNGPTVNDGRPFFEEVIFLNGEFLATADQGVIYRSADGVTWMHLYPGLTMTAGIMATANGRLLMARGSEIYMLNVPDTGGPVVAQNPAGQELVEGATLTLTANFTGANLEFVWLFNGQPLANGGRVSGANTTTLRIAGILPSDAGAYSLAANNASGSRVTVAANVSVIGLPVIVQQPANLSLTLGGAGTLSAEVAGAGLSHQWFRNGAAIEGATSASFAIDEATVAAAGVYHLEVRNSAGMVQSNPVSVSVRSMAAGLALDAWVANIPFTVPSAYISTIGVAPDGKVLLSGYFQAPNPNGGQFDSLIRLNADGTIDTTFNPPAPDSQIEVFHFLPNGQILIGGGFARLSGVAAPGLVRLNANGTIDASYNAGVGPNYSGPYTMKVRGDGKILVGGSFTTFGGGGSLRLGLLNADGTPDLSFTSSGANNQITSLDTQSDGKIIITGYFTSPGSGSRVYRFDATGAPDPTFNTGGAGIGTGAPFQFPLPKQVTVAAGDKVYLAGKVGTFNNQFAVGLFRMNANGTFDNTFSVGINALETPTPAVESFVPVGDKIVFGGSFQSVRGDATKKYLAIVDASGQLTSGLNIGTGPNNSINRLAPGLNGSIFVAGNFTQINGEPRVKLAKLAPSGGEALPLNITVPMGVMRVAAGANAAISVGATGHGSLSFQWRRGEQNLAGQTSATLTLANVQQADAGVYTVVVTDSNGSASANVELAVGEDQPTGFAGWAAALPEGQRGENDDPDGDRLSNIAEYAMGTNATVADAAERPAAATVQVEGQAYAGIRFTRNRNATGVTIEVNASDTVTFAAPAQVVETIEDLGNGLERVTVRSAQPLPAVVRFFLRVNARQN